jgi:uncharacterized membrane protein
VELALLLLHVLAAAVWVGGTVALVFVAVPSVRALPGLQRAAALRRIASRWHPIGYGSLGVLGSTGLLLGAEHRLFGDPLVRAKLVIGPLLLVLALLHDFVLGPRFAEQLSNGSAPRLRPWLVSVGWASFTLTIVLPVLGVLLTWRLR